MTPMAAVIFDLFDTLVALPAGVYVATKREMARALELEAEAFLQAWRGTSAAANRGELATVEARVLASAAALGAKVDPVALTQAVALERSMQATGYHLLPGARELLTTLYTGGRKVGILSNCYAGAAGVAEALGLRAWVQDVVLSWEVGLAKPAPEVYRLTCQRLDCPPAGTWFVGDGNDRELDGARAAGLRTILVRHTTSAVWATTPSTTSDYAVANLAAVLPVLMGNNTDAPR